MHITLLVDAMSRSPKVKLILYTDMYLGGALAVT